MLAARLVGIDTVLVLNELVGNTILEGEDREALTALFRILHLDQRVKDFDVQYFVKRSKID